MTFCLNFCGYKFRPPLMVGGNGHREASALKDTVPQYQAVAVPGR